MRALGVLVLAGLAAGCGGNTITGAPTDSGSEADVAPNDVDAAGDPASDGDRAEGGDGGPARCTVAPVPAAFMNPVTELHWRGAGLVFPNQEQVIVSPVVIDFLDDLDDTIPEVVFVSYRTVNVGGVLRVVSGRSPHATRMTLAGDGTLPDDPAGVPSFRFDAHPAAADLDGDGRPEIVALLQGGGAVAIRHDGTEVWRTSAAALPAAETQPNGSVAIADLDHDGFPEVVVGRVVVDGQTGAVRWTGTGGQGLNVQGPLSCVADLDGTGSMEIVAGRTVYRADGTILWQAAAATGDGFCAVADLTDATGAAAQDGVPEVVRVASGVLYLHDGVTGVVRWSRALPACTSAGGFTGGTAGSGGAPTVADFDGDGLAEVGVAGAWCYTVFDPGCAAAAMPAGCAAAGILWRAPTQDDSSNVTSSTVFDFNGDGRAEVVYNDEQYFMVLDGQTGATVFRDPNPSRTRTEQPVVADVDNDGNAEIVFSANTEAAFAGNMIPAAERVPGLEIWSSADDSWVGARPIWNQHTYHITNVSLTGVVPPTEVPSWIVHDTYRLNVALGDALAAPDLSAAPAPFDASRCGLGVLRVCAQVQNQGDVRVGPGILVTFYDGDPAAGGVAIGSATTSGALDPGGVAETVCVDWSPAPTVDRRVFVEVDAAGAARECVETNNTLDVGLGSCPPIG